MIFNADRISHSFKCVRDDYELQYSENYTANIQK